jgi:hypothetical protein
MILLFLIQYCGARMNESGPDGYNSGVRIIRCEMPCMVFNSKTELFLRGLRRNIQLRSVNRYLHTGSL